MALSNVDFPEPDGPNRVQSTPFSKEKFISFKTEIFNTYKNPHQSVGIVLWFRKNNFCLF